MSTGGPLTEVSIHGRIFSVASDADVKKDLGGFKNKFESNGDGTTRTIKERKTWSLAGIKLSCDQGRGDQEFLQEKADAAKNGDITATSADGTTYGGRGNVIDDIVFDEKTSTIDVSLAGPGKLEAQ
jgi:hypothetical protein